MGFVHGRINVTTACAKHLADYASKDWLFRTPTGWSRVRREDHCGYLLKLTDFSDTM